MNYMIPIVYFV